MDGVASPAVPPEAAARLLPACAAAPGPGPEAPRELGASPIVNVHVLYDRQVTSLPFAAAVDSPVQWVFDRTGPSGLDAGQYLAVSVSAADDVVDTPAAQLRERFVPALEEIFPAARDARITDFFVTRERRATFRQEPGCGEKRPGATTRLPGLVLAGAWTNTGVARHDGGCRAKRTVRSARAAARDDPITSRGARGHAGGRGSRGRVVTAVMPAGVETARDLVGPAIAAASPPAQPGGPDRRCLSPGAGRQRGG